MKNGIKEIYTIEVDYYPETDIPKEMNIRLLTGEFHSPPDGRPSSVEFDDQGRPTEMAWHHRNLLHRFSGPAMVRINPENGVHIAEFFRIVVDEEEDVARGQNELSTIFRDEITGEVKQKMYGGRYSNIKGHTEGLKAPKPIR
ncbi:hypothetical protein [Stappia sp. ES.058]|uniref:hypothetical protein n=1 Tax=Stappia sp. ES.058 TaxID=1881061 RepID=UPI0012FD825B|nr:hypothetical protein [Stappia sp. ES.058]